MMLVMCCAGDDMKHGEKADGKDEKASETVGADDDDTGVGSRSVGKGYSKFALTSKGVPTIRWASVGVCYSKTLLVALE